MRKRQKREGLRWTEREREECGLQVAGLRKYSNYITDLKRSGA